MGMSIDELAAELTEDEVLERMLSIAEELGVPARSWRKGGPLRVIIRVCARLYAGFTVLMAAFIRSGFLESASGEWLTKLAYYVYGVTRREATHATGTIRLVNTGGSLFDDNPIGSVTVINPTTEKAYRNAVAFTLNPLATLDVEFEAVEEGTDSNAALGDIDELETNLSNVTVSNVTTFIAVDDESDAEVRQACKDKLASLSVRGPRGAYRWAVRVAEREDGSPVNVNRISVSTSSSTGTVDVYIASPTGEPTAEDLTAIEDSIEERVRPDAVTVNVDSATPVTVSRSLTIYADREDGVSADDIRELVEAAFLREGPRYPIGGRTKPPAAGGKVWADWIIGVAKGAHPSIYEVDGEGADVTLAAGEVPVFEVEVELVRLAEPGIV